MNQVAGQIFQAVEKIVRSLLNVALVNSWSNLFCVVLSDVKATNNDLIKHIQAY